MLTPTEPAVRCPVCSGTEAREFHASPAGRDPYARAAGISPDAPITSHFCLGCGVIFNLPRMLDGLARNVYSKNLPVHPHGAMNFRQFFKPYAASIISGTVARGIGRVLQRSLRGEQLALLAALHDVVADRRRPLEARIERDWAILQGLLGQAGRADWRPREVLMLGCPLMSFMAAALHRRHGARLTSLVAFDENYWGDDCRINGQICLRATPVFARAVRAEQWEDLSRYDFVYVAEALDHTYDTEGTMRRLAGHLTPEGLVCIQNHVFLERKVSFSRFAAQHAVIFTEASWQNLLRRSGFEQMAIDFDRDDFYALVRPAPPRPLERQAPTAYEAARAIVRALRGG